MEEKKNNIEPLVELFETYAMTRYELIKLKALDKTAGVVSTFVYRGAVILFLTMFTVLVSVGAALWVGELLGKSYYGFFCVAGFYGFTGGVIYFLFRDKIKARVGNSIIKQILN